MRDDEGSDDDEEEGDCVYVVDVLPCNMLAVEVFQCCELATVSGMTIGWLGIAADEIRSACQMLEIERELWPTLLLDVRHMGKAAARYLNSQRPKKGD